MKYKLLVTVVEKPSGITHIFYDDYAKGEDFFEIKAFLYNRASNRFHELYVMERTFIKGGNKYNDYKYEIVNLSDKNLK